MKRTMKDLRAAAKERGINSFGMTKAALIEALDGGSREPSAEDSTQRAPEPASAEATAGRHDPGSRGERPTTREETGRRARVPLGSMKTKLDYPSRPGYVRRWFNDQGNRLYDAGRAGYEFVEETNEGRTIKVSRRVGTHDDGQPLMAYLMEIRQEFYDEDQAIKQKVVDDIDAAIRSGEPRETGAAEPGKFYTPAEGTSMTPGSRT